MENRRYKAVENKKRNRLSIRVKHTDLPEVFDDGSAEASSALDSAGFEDNAAQIEHATAEVLHSRAFRQNLGKYK